MSKLAAKQIDVYADWIGLEKPSRLGLLIATPSRGKEIFSFEYDPTWLKKNKAPLLDPSLQLFQSTQYAPSQQSNFGVFIDSSPDRWGRVLMDRREAQLAREENRTEKKLLESDYLMGVYDLHRLGALRFRLPHHDFFLDNNEKYAAPPWTLLRELEHASLSIEKDNAEKNRHYSQWLKLLIAPGGSLGGARPKASVIDEKNIYGLRNFPVAMI